MRWAHRGNAHAILQGDGRRPGGYSLAVVTTDDGLLCLVLGLLWWTGRFAVAYGMLLVANSAFLALATAPLAPRSGPQPALPDLRQPRPAPDASATVNSEATRSR